MSECSVTTCPLYGEVEVPYSGGKSAHVFIVGESPGAEEIKRGQPFIGRSGQLLRNTLAEVGFLDHELFFANACRCRIDKDKLSTAEIKLALECCRPKLVKAIEILQPDLIIALGDIAMRQVLKSRGISKMRGQIHKSEFDIPTLVTWHPAYILRNPNKGYQFEGDLKLAYTYLYGGEEKQTFITKEVDSIAPFLEKKNTSTAIDTETQGLQWYKDSSPTLSFSIAVSPNEGWNVILYEECPPDDADFSIASDIRGEPIYIKKARNFEKKMEELRELCARRDIKKYFMNQNYDTHRFNQLGLTELNNAPMDIGLAAHVLDSAKFLRASLGDLQDVFLGTNVMEQKRLFSGREKGDMLYQMKEDRDSYNKYAAMDAIGTHEVAKKIKEEFMKDRKSAFYYVHLAHPVTTKVLYDMETNGFLIDVDKIDDTLKEVDTLLKDKVETVKGLCPNAILDKYGDNFKLSRTAILRDLLFSYYDADGKLVNIGYGLEPQKLSGSTKMPSCDKESLQLLAEGSIPKEVSTILDAYTTWKQYHTLKTRYLAKLRYYTDKGNRVHSSFSLGATSTGRSASKDPNIQNIPKRGEIAPVIRRLFIAPKGRVLLESDYSQSELRMVAYIADEYTMKKLIKEGVDLHTYVAENILNTSADEIEDLELARYKAKALNFGLIYGMGPNGLRRSAHLDYGVYMSEREARKYRENYFERFNLLPYWHNSVRQELREKGYVTSIYGRKRYFPEMSSPDASVRAQAERIGINYLVQGPNSDTNYLAALQILEDPNYNREEIRLIDAVHDSLIFEIDEDKVDKYARLIKYHQEHVDTRKFGFEIDVPLVVDVKVGPNLWDMEKYNVTGE